MPPDGSTGFANPALIHPLGYTRHFPTPVPNCPADLLQSGTPCACVKAVPPRFGIIFIQRWKLNANHPPTAFCIVRKRFGFDMVAVRENTAELDEAVAFFKQVRGKPGLRKGILRLTL